MAQQPQLCRRWRHSPPRWREGLLRVLRAPRPIERPAVALIACDQMSCWQKGAAVEARVLALGPNFDF